MRASQLKVTSVTPLLMKKGLDRSVCANFLTNYESPYHLEDQCQLDEIDLGDVQIEQSESVRSLVVIDNTVPFDIYFTSVCKAANHYARDLRHIRKIATTDVAVSIATTMV